jgi:magnesium-transporting ATPase (P-type)
MDMDAASIVKPAGDVSPWHAMTADEVIKRINTDAKSGLDEGEVASRLKRYGSNRLPEGTKRGPFIRFLSQFNNILVYVLLGAGFTKMMLNLWLDAAIIFAVVILNSLLGFIQEGRAEKALGSIRNMLSAAARTVRGGETRMIAADQLVPGDVVLLESGDKVPADLRLAEVNNFRTEEAALTGESVPTDKTTEAVSANATVGDRECMAFSGTMVVSGRATGVVVATGSETELGRINQLLASVTALETPLLRQIKHFGYVITAVIGIVGLLVFAYGKWVKGMDFVEIFQAVVGIAVSVIPEGLPALITITLAIGVQRMAQRNAIIRRLPAVETLGSVSRICSDKTGTLTLMEMMVVSAATAESEYGITGDGYAPEGAIQKNGKPVGKDPQERRFLARVHGPLRQWKLSPMDLESYERWYQYSKARDVMLKATDTKFAPWHIVRSDDKRRARLNCISHILKTVPPGKVLRSKVKLPRRANKSSYDDQAALKRVNFVAEKY